MNEPNLYKLSKNCIFEKIAIPYTNEEYKNKEQQIVYNGLQPTIHTWKNMIVKGHDEYKICQEWNIPFFKEELAMDSILEVTSWLCLESIKTKNLTPSHLRYCIGKLYNSEKQRQLTSYPLHDRFYQLQPKQKSKNPSRERVVELIKDYVEIRSGTTYIYNIYATALDEIDAKVPGLARQLLAEKFQISQSMTIRIADYSAEEITLLFRQITEKNDTSFLYSDYQRKRVLAKQHAKAKTTPAPVKKKNAPEIKNMPPYDPDAEISSVTLTIPMWINSLKRAQNNAKLDKASETALEKFHLQLNQLQLQISHLQSAIQEEQHERRRNPK